MERTSVFLAIEGLTGTGKTTVAKMIAREFGYQFIDFRPAEFQEAFTFLDKDQQQLEARHALYFSAGLCLAEKVKESLLMGEKVVTDTWLYRTVATHAALGSQLTIEIPLSVPRPDVTIILTVPEPLRKARIGIRGIESGHWKVKCEDHSESILAIYQEIAANPVYLDNSDGSEMIQMGIRRIVEDLQSGR